MLLSLTNVQTAPDTTMKPLTDHVDMAANAIIAFILREALQNTKTASLVLKGPI